MGIFHSGLYLSWNGFLHHQFTEYNAVCSDTHSPLVCMSRCIICILICLSDHLTFCVQYNTGVKKCSFYDIRTPAVYTGNVGDHRTDPVLMRCSVKTFALVVVISGICGFSVAAFIYSILFDRIFKKYEPESTDNIE